MTEPAIAQQPAETPAGQLAPPSAAPAPRVGAITDGAFETLSLDDQNRYARVKNGDSGAQWVHRDHLTAEPANTNATPSDPVAKVKVGDMEVSQAELQEFFKSKGEAELRKASLPDAPEKYEAKLPENFEMPAGIEYKIDESDPLLTDARRWAHTKGLDQATFSEMVGLYASAKAKEAAQLSAAHAAEVAKMGANGTQRVTALETWLRGLVGDRLAGPMRTMMVTADIVKGLETIQQKFSSQGAASFSQAHREPANPAGRASDAEYEAMSPTARLDYARSFDQRQFKEAR